MLKLGTTAPPFALPDTEGNTVCTDDFVEARALVVMFLSNHCPYVKHVRYEIAALAREYQPRGVAFVGIGANDVQRYPADSPDMMRREKEAVGYPFSYLFDETQQVAKAYQAACTPDFFVFGPQQELVYRGQLDDSRPGGSVPVTGRDLRAALDAVLNGTAVPAEQRPSLGCNIKWKPGNEPNYFA
jgi:peroxiredoxin